MPVKVQALIHGRHLIEGKAQHHETRNRIDPDHFTRQNGFRWGVRPLPGTGSSGTVSLDRDLEDIYPFRKIMLLAAL